MRQVRVYRWPARTKIHAQQRKKKEGEEETGTHAGRAKGRDRGSVAGGICPKVDRFPFLSLSLVFFF